MNKKTSISIIGLGYVGLPLAELCISKDIFVYGIDSDKIKIKLLNSRLSKKEFFSLFKF